MTYSQYIVQSWQDYLATPGLRIGQVLFNLLLEVRPEAVRSTVHDPFYCTTDDLTALGRFYEHVAERWDA